jgi:hypothetical protein
MPKFVLPTSIDYQVVEEQTYQQQRVSIFPSIIYQGGARYKSFFPGVSPSKPQFQQGKPLHKTDFEP